MDYYIGIPQMLMIWARHMAESPCPHVASKPESDLNGDEQILMRRFKVISTFGSFSKALQTAAEMGELGSKIE